MPSGLSVFMIGAATTPTAWSILSIGCGLRCAVGRSGRACIHSALARRRGAVMSPGHSRINWASGARRPERTWLPDWGAPVILRMLCCESAQDCSVRQRSRCMPINHGAIHDESRWSHSPDDRVVLSIQPCGRFPVREDAPRSASLADGCAWSYAANRLSSVAAHVRL